MNSQQRTALPLIVNQAPPLQTRRSLNRFGTWTNTTWLQQQTNGTSYQRKKDQSRYHVIIWDKYPLVRDLLAQTSAPQISVRDYQYYYRNVRDGFRKHLKYLSWYTLRDWKTKYSHPEEIAKLRRCFTAITTARWRRMKAKNCTNRLESPQWGATPILEEFVCTKREFKSQRSRDRSVGWITGEMRRVVRSPIHFSILNDLMDREGVEAARWNTLRFSKGHLRKMMVG